MNTQIKTIDLNARTWFDKVNGNSYFSVLIMLDFGLESEKEIYLPMQYGYGEQYEAEAVKELKREGYLSECKTWLREYCNDNNIVLRVNHRKNCLKRELKRENY